MFGYLNFGRLGPPNVGGKRGPNDLRSLFPETQFHWIASRYTSGDWIDSIAAQALTFIGDPAITGDYFALDANDAFKTTALITEAVIRDLHKTTGGADATLLFLGRAPAAWTGTKYLFSNTDFTAGAAGFDVRFTSTGQMQVTQTLGGSTASDFTIVSTGQTLTANTPYAIAIAINSSTPMLKTSINGTSFTTHVYAPKATTANPTKNLRVGVNVLEGASNFIGNGAEVAQVAIINKILSDAELAQAVAFMEAL